MVDIYRIIGQRIAKRRVELNFTQEYLASITGLHRNYIGYIERAEKHVSIINLQKIANALDMKLYELFYGN